MLYRHEKYQWLRPCGQSSRPSLQAMHFRCESRLTILNSCRSKPYGLQPWIRRVSNCYSWRISRYLHELSFDEQHIWNICHAQFWLVLPLWIGLGFPFHFLKFYWWDWHFWYDTWIKFSVLLSKSDLKERFSLGSIQLNWFDAPINHHACQYRSPTQTL